MTKARHEGETIKKLLDEIKKAPADLARVRDVSQSAISKQLSNDVIGERSWPRIKEGLRKMQIDPTRVRDEPLVMGRERARPAAVVDFRPVLSTWDSSQLAQLRQVLLQPESHEPLIYWLDGKLDR